LKDFIIIKDQFKINEILNLNLKFKFNNNLYHGKDTKLVTKFNCLICREIVDNPIKCANCSKFFCKICIEDELLKNNNKCPHCNTSPFNKDKIDSIVQEILDDFQFKCPIKCGKVIRYSDQEKHKKECVLIKQSYQCNLCKNELTENDKLIHKTQCISLKSRCVQCDDDLNILEFTDHLQTCQKEIKFCETSNIYYSKNYEQAYQQEFKNLLSNFNSFYLEIKKLSIFF